MSSHENDTEVFEVSLNVLNSETVDTQTLTTAIDAMRSWLDPSGDHLAIHSTASLLRCKIIEREQWVSDCVLEDARMVDLVSTYGLALIRLCNGTLDSKQRSNARPMRSIAQEIGFPVSIVDMRQQLTHSPRIPCINRVRVVAQEALSFLKHTYWQPLMTSLIAKKEQQNEQIVKDFLASVSTGEIEKFPTEKLLKLGTVELRNLLFRIFAVLKSMPPHSQVFYSDEVIRNPFESGIPVRKSPIEILKGVIDAIICSDDEVPEMTKIIEGCYSMFTHVFTLKPEISNLRKSGPISQVTSHLVKSLLEEHRKIYLDEFISEDEDLPEIANNDIGVLNRVEFHDLSCVETRESEDELKCFTEIRASRIARIQV